MFNSKKSIKRETVKKVIYEPSDKAKDVFINAGLATHRLLEGAVRSSKSYTANDLAIDEIQDLPACSVLISGYSIGSVSRNVIAEWKAALDPYELGIFKMVREDKDEYLKIQWRGLRNKKFYIRGAGKENDFKQIQGATFGYWYCDEATRHTKSFIEMALSRCSLEYSKSIWTMNPDNPFHFVKTDFLDKEELFAVDENGFSEFRRWTFYMEDNPSLSARYIRSLSMTYSGVFYSRYVLSQWVAAEGLIYDFFTAKDHVLEDDEVPEVESYYLACDYGTGNPTAVGLFGRNDKSRPRVWLDQLFYYDSKKEGKQLSDEEYVDRIEAALLKWKIKKEKIRCFVLDPSAASFKLALSRRGFMVKAAVNDVINGIRLQTQFLKSRLYAIRKHCTQAIKDYAAYLWDAKQQEIGIDAPIKKNDHTKDMERYLLATVFGIGSIDYTLMTAT